MSLKEGLNIILKLKICFPHYYHVYYQAANVSIRDFSSLSPGIEICLMALSWAFNRWSLLPYSPSLSCLLIISGCHCHVQMFSQVTSSWELIQYTQHHITKYEMSIIPKLSSHHQNNFVGWEITCKTLLPPGEARVWRAPPPSWLLPQPDIWQVVRTWV